MSGTVGHRRQALSTKLIKQQNVEPKTKDKNLKKKKQTNPNQIEFFVCFVFYFILLI